MTRRLTLDLPGQPPPGFPGERPLRLLAVSDQPDRAFDFEPNRASIAPLDAIIGCGDLEPDYLCFLADAFHVPLLFVRGNHDRGAHWETGRRNLPRRLDGRIERIGGMAVAGMSWPGDVRGRAGRDGFAAWRQALSIASRGLTRGVPSIVISHAPPLDHGDTPEDDYHRGFSAYRWLFGRIKPILWLHGHTSLAAARDWKAVAGRTTFVNVTGAVLIEIADPRAGGHAARPPGATIERQTGAAAGVGADEGTERAEEH